MMLESVLGSPLVFVLGSVLESVLDFVLASAWGSVLVVLSGIFQRVA